MFSGCHFRRSALVAAVILGSASRAQTADCEINTFALARVVGKDARVHFLAGSSERGPGCPSADNECRRKAYVMRGDEVLTGPAHASYVCGLFKSQGGRETIGWLPRTALQPVPSTPAPARRWQGKWQRDQEAQIALKAHNDELEISGNATWGSHDPQRVRRGGVHVGVLDGKAKPRGQTAAIGYDPEKSDFPRASGEPAEDCVAKLELLGRYLVAEDNGGCGGMNVSFSGVYVRTR